MTGDPLEGDRTLVSGERYCPICDRDVGAEYCTDHGVCTISVGVTTGAPPTIGRIVAGRYHLEELIGKGGMGAVYRATQLGVKREVAVKVLLPDLTSERRVVKRFYREAFAVSQMNHPNIVRLVDFGVDPSSNSPFMVLDLVHGQTLRALYDKGGRMAERRAANLMAQLAKGLVDAHLKGVVHRDLKPENLMVELLAGGDEHLRILDFGLTRILDEPITAGRITESGTVLGTPLYMSPEQATGAPIDPRSDLYSLGCILYELLAGKPVFHGLSTLAVLTHHVYTPAPTLPDQLVDGSPPSPEMVSLFKRLLEKKPDDRPAGADEVARALTQMAMGPGRESAQPALPMVPAQPPPQARIGYLLAFTAVLAVGATFLLMRASSGPPAVEAVDDDEQAVPVIRERPSPATVPTATSADR